MEELKRKKNVLNMMVSMHSFLHHRYYFWSKMVDGFLLVSAIILNSLIFIDFKYLSGIFRNQEQANIYVGIFSFITFTLSVLLFIIKWKEKAEAHLTAKNELTSLLNEARSILDSEELLNNDMLLNSFNSKYDQVLSMVISVPDNKFLKLKSRHLRKVELSKFVSKNAGSFYFITWLKFHFGKRAKESNKSG